MRRATVEIVVDEAKTKDYLLCAVVAVSEVPAPGPHDDARARGRTTAGRRHRRDERPAEPVADRGGLRPHIGRSGRPTYAPPRIAGRPHRQVPGRLPAALAVHSAELGARRILVESCAQDTQDLAAHRRPRPHRGAHDGAGEGGPPVRARVAVGRGPDRLRLHRQRTAAACDRLAGHRGSGAVDKRKGRATTQNVRAPGLTFLTLRQDTLNDSGPLPHRPAPRIRECPRDPGADRHRDTGRRPMWPPGCSTRPGITVPASHPQRGRCIRRVGRCPGGGG
ncbi:hypothetical protein AIIKEEIJ_06264 [Rhodococcus sp. YH1]|nr:hypothetical protein [Rhodococcus sp. YH1]NCL78755.1 hypothetical protein [Rhodococcus sp. YH1]